MRLILLTFALLALVFGSSAVNARHLLNPELHAGVYHPSADSFLDWLGQDFYFDITDRINAPQLGDIGRSFLKKLYSWIPSWLQTNKKVESDGKAEEYPYFKWIPYYHTSALVDGPEVHWTAPCFADSSAKVTRNADGKSYTLTLNLNNPTGFLCNDFYFFATVEGVKLQPFFAAGQHTITWEPKANARPAEVWDIETKGIRIFRFLGGEIDVVEWVLATANLFEPLGTKAVSDAAAAANLDFLKKYANIQTMNLRNSTGLPIDPNLIQSGDFLGVIRLDGLDPMLAWAMGAHTGHTTIAMWEGGVLYIMESTTNSTYWPTNGIQKTPFNIWIEQARDAGYNVVWSPLKDEVRKNFNISAALEFFYDHEGYDYGYYNMLMAWIDTPQNNYPCVAPDYKLCLRWEQVEILIGILDNVAPAASDLLFRQAFNNRLGTQGLMAAELFQLADKQGIPYRMLPTIPEKDSYIYHLNRNWEPTTGQSMVCCVFVCSMWKAGGVFDSINREVNCGEMTNWDDYTLDILEFSPARSIPQCMSQDPENDLCQLTGKYGVILTDHGSRHFYPHMAEKCSAEAPDYIRPANC